MLPLLVLAAGLYAAIRGERRWPAGALLDAAAYERRRLLTALVSGRLEAEPARPGRVAAAGVALAALTVAVAALAGVLAPDAPVA